MANEKRYFCNNSMCALVGAHTAECLKLRAHAIQSAQKSAERPEPRKPQGEARQIYCCECADVDYCQPDCRCVCHDRKPEPDAGLEKRVADWVVSRIGPDHMNRRERTMRHLEESIELAQAEGITAEQVLKQAEHVFARPAGDPDQEAGGVAVCLLGWCAATGNRFEDLALREIQRIEAKPIDQIRGSVARKTDADLVVCVPETDAGGQKDASYADAMIAHRWFEKHFGEQMNGRDFAVKCEMADREMTSLVQRAAFGDQCWQDRCEGALIEASVVKRIDAAQSAAERELEAKLNALMNELMHPVAHRLLTPHTRKLAAETRAALAAWKAAK